MQIRRLWASTRSSFWFLPALMVAGSVGLALGLTEVDVYIDPLLLERWPSLFGAGAEGARGLLSTVASSMITVAGVTFSITIVALSLASTYYSPRVLRNFMSDRTNQTVLGVFVSIFAYCLVVLRTIRSGEEGLFVPAVAVFVSVLLALVGIGFLIFFIHYVASSIQASSIIAAAAQETLKAIDHKFPELGRDDETPHGPETELEWDILGAPASGYIQGIDTDALEKLAAKQGLTLRMESGIGEFIVTGKPLLSVHPAHRSGQDLDEALKDIYAIGPRRTIDDDISFGIEQIVDIALKGLSPGINDTTTAITCIDYLTVILCRIAGRRVGPRFMSKPGVIFRGPRFENLLESAFGPIRRNAGDKFRVLERLLWSAAVIDDGTDHPHRRALLEQVGLIAEIANRTVESSQDKATLEVHISRVVRQLSQDYRHRSAALPRKESQV